MKCINSFAVTTLATTLCILSSTTLQAGERSSANYTITTDATDTGGHEVTSANYTQIGSAGLISGISNKGTEIVAKSGYIAQLYDITGLALSSALADVDEGGTNQVAGFATVDDDTFLALTSTDITWGVSYGPIAGIDLNGLATASIVYETAQAEVQATWQGHQAVHTFNVININNDDFGSYAGDGMNDAWQVVHFGEGNALAGKDMDPDGDGQSNLEEYLTGTIPTDIGSVFKPSAIYSATELEISIDTIQGRKYIVQTTSDLLSWNVHEEFAGTGTTVTSTITGIDTKQKLFYRVLVSVE